MIKLFINCWGWRGRDPFKLWSAGALCDRPTSNWVWGRVTCSLKARSHCTCFIVMKHDETGQWNTLKHHETERWNSNETAWNSAVKHHEPKINIKKSIYLWSPSLIQSVLLAWNSVFHDHETVFHPDSRCFTVFYDHEINGSLLNHPESTSFITVSSLWFILFHADSTCFITVSSLFHQWERALICLMTGWGREAVLWSRGGAGAAEQLCHLYDFKEQSEQSGVWLYSTEKLYFTF